MGRLLTLSDIEPALLAMRTMLPPFPKRTICRPAACAVNITPLTLTSITCGMHPQLLISCPSRRDRLTFRKCDSGYSRQSVMQLMIPAAATHASMRPSLSPITCPIFHIPAYEEMCNFSVHITAVRDRSHLVSNIATNIFQPALAALVRHAGRIVMHFLPLLGRLLGHVDAVHCASPGLDKRKRHLEPKPAVPARDERDTVCERELVLEERGRWRGTCAINQDAYA